jgi:hypothetical protein
MLGAMETEEFVVFPGSCLAGDEDGVANGDSDVEMLENLTTNNGSDWLRGCSQLPGEDGVEALADCSPPTTCTTR